MNFIVLLLGSSYSRSRTQQIDSPSELFFQFHAGAVLRSKPSQPWVPHPFALFAKGLGTPTVESECSWVVVHFGLLTTRCHPERSRFSGEAKDLSLIRL